MARKPPKFMALSEAVSRIKQVCESANGKGHASPFFFLVGAGISNPPVPLARDIIADCKDRATKLKRSADPSNSAAMGDYSHWLDQAFPSPSLRKDYFASLIRNKPISSANFRLAHVLLSEPGCIPMANVVVTPNFDDFLSRALHMFGKYHLVCDHPATTARLLLEERQDLQLIHVHGSYRYYDIANLTNELAAVATHSLESTATMPATLDTVLRLRVPLVIGYSGWDGDVVMAALRRRLEGQFTLPEYLYWFCHKRDTTDCLPEWLCNHNMVYFVAPDEDDVRGSGELGVTASGVPDTFARSGVGSPLDERVRETSLDAVQVFNAFIQAFEYPTPAATKQPLQFLAGRMRGEFPLADMENPSASGLYGLSQVVAKIERANVLLIADEKETGLRTRIEAVRDAVTRSDFALAFSRGNELVVGAADDDAAEELAILFWQVGLEMTAKSDEKLAAYELAIRFADKRNNPSPRLARAASNAMVLNGNELAALHRPEQAVAAYDALLRRFGDAEEPVLREQVARALVNKGITLGELKRRDEEIAAYDQVLLRFGESREPGLSKQVARALVNKGITLGLLDQGEAAIAAYDEVLRRFGTYQELALRESVAIALVTKGFQLGRLDRGEEEIVVYDEVLRRFGEDVEPALREQVALALFQKGLRLSTLSRGEEEIATYDALLRRLEDSPQSTIRELVAGALINKGFRLGQLNRGEEAIAAYNEVLRRFGQVQESALQERVARALVNKGVILGQLNRDEEEVAVCDEVVRRFGGASESGLREQVARAICNKADTLAKLNRVDQAVAAYDEVVRRIGDAMDPALQEQVAIALINKAAILVERNGVEPDAAYQEVVKRFGNTMDPTLRRHVATAMGLSV